MWNESTPMLRSLSLVHHYILAHLTQMCGNWWINELCNYRQWFMSTCIMYIVSIVATYIFPISDTTLDCIQSSSWTIYICIEWFAFVCIFTVLLHFLFVAVGSPFNEILWVGIYQKREKICFSLISTC